MTVNSNLRQPQAYVKVLRDAMAVCQGGPSIYIRSTKTRYGPHLKIPPCLRSIGSVFNDSSRLPISPNPVLTHPCPTLTPVPRRKVSR